MLLSTPPETYKVRYKNIMQYLVVIEELDGAAVSALGVRSRKLRNVLKGQS
jgi:hypothetical protein